MNATRLVIVKTPWEDESRVLGQLIIDNLRNYLLRAHTGENGVDVESLMVGTGAVVGTFATIAAPSRAFSTPSNQSAPPARAIEMLEALPPDEAFDSQWIDDSLYPIAPQPNRLSFASLLFVTLLQLGVNERDWPNLQETVDYFENVEESPASEKVRTIEGHRPLIEPRQALRRIWNDCLNIMNHHKHKELPENEKPLLVVHWPVLGAIVGTQLIEICKDSMNPILSSQIQLEAAIISSHIKWNAK